MVDVGWKRVTRREAVAEAWVDVGDEVAAALDGGGGLPKGDPFETARLAGIMAAKRTPELIPLCHPLPIELAEVEVERKGRRVHITSRVVARARTGVEMEAMTAAAVAALALYDMIKSLGRGAEIGPVRLLRKVGGKSGHWKRKQ